MSKKLVHRQTEIHNLASLLGADYRYVYDESCTHLIHQVYLRIHLFIYLLFDWFICLFIESLIPFYNHAYSGVSYYQVSIETRSPFEHGLKSHVFLDIKAGILSNMLFNGGLVRISFEFTWLRAATLFWNYVGFSREGRSKKLLNRLKIMTEFSAF